MKPPQEQANHHPITECCNYFAPLHLPYPVMWNEFNKVVQCHNCGHIWAPKCPEFIAVAQAANQLVSAQTHAAQFNYEELLVDAIIALRATGKVEL